MSDLQSAVSEAESILDGGRSVRRIWAPDYFFGVFTCFGFRFSRPRLSLLTPAVCHESLNLHQTISSPRENQRHDTVPHAIVATSILSCGSTSVFTDSCSL